MIDLSNKNVTGYEASDTLASVGIILNKNVIPYDKLNPNITSGIRIGTPAVTTQGMGVGEMHKIGDYISYVINNRDNKAVISDIAQKVKKLVSDFPVYSNMTIS